ncbi:hypothetical protein M422DRAFT_33861 [Sphaerobolus stellatus SS14]|uniref:Uncharacterized protein n=1 Tax=Sphaerobolus stellatus (strain SS14) TaxID=990650 RepID=A0A0C9VJ40_SPHS4|nr:hypothetical protein M422DRAFT_33861 [Sphaerobolus stellatus SS14]
MVASHSFNVSLFLCLLSLISLSLYLKYNRTPFWTISLLNSILHYIHKSTYKLQSYTYTYIPALQ